MAESLKKLGRYTLLDRISEGESADIHRAMHSWKGIQRLVSIKCFRSTQAYDSKFWQLFRKESKVSLRLSHPGIVQAFDFGKHGGRPFIVFEYVHGRSLAHVIDCLKKTERFFAQDIAVFIGAEVSGALQYAHEFHDSVTETGLNVIHRRISPKKILLNYEGAPKIIDFGVAKFLQESERTNTSQAGANPGYLAPEQLLGEPPDPRADIFALGVVLWECLTGRKLFHGTDRASIQEMVISEDFSIIPPSSINPDVPPELDELILKAVARDRNQRFKSTREMHDGLLRHLHSVGKTRDQCASELSAVLQQTLAAEIRDDRNRLKTLGSQASEITRTNVDHPSWLIPEGRSYVTSTSLRSLSLAKSQTSLPAQALIGSSGARELEVEEADIGPHRPILREGVNTNAIATVVPAAEPATENNDRTKTAELAPALASRPATMALAGRIPPARVVRPEDLTAEEPVAVIEISRKKLWAGVAAVAILVVGLAVASVSHQKSATDLALSTPVVPPASIAPPTSAPPTSAPYAIPPPARVMRLPNVAQSQPRRGPASTSSPYGTSPHYRLSPARGSSGVRPGSTYRYRKPASTAKSRKKTVAKKKKKTIPRASTTTSAPTSAK